MGNWLEIIKVRTNKADAAEAGETMARFMAEQRETAEAVRFGIHYGMAHQNEVMLMLNWGGRPPGPGGSALARGLAFSLKQFGLVDHSVWGPDKGTRAPSRERINNGEN